MAGDISHVLSAFQQTPWAIHVDKLMEMRAFLAARVFGKEDILEALQARGDELAKQRQSRLDAVLAEVQSVEPKAARRGDGVILAGRTAVVPIMGTLMQRVSALERSSGGVSSEELGATIDALVADQTVKSIALLIDSPGGSVYGLPEVASKVRSARDSKKVVAHADPLAASAAYWIASQASEVSVSPSGQVGSVGVLVAHEDASKLYETMGIKTTLIASSQFKTENNPFEPMTDAGRADLVSKVQSYHEMFVGDIAKGRNITAHRVEKDYGAGRMKMADAAKASGMVDRVGTFADVLRRLGAGGVTAEEAAPVIVAQDQGPPLAARLASVRARALEVSQR